MAKEAVQFIEKHKDQPFFLNYWMFSVHAPFDAKNDLIEKYRDYVLEKNRYRYALDWQKIKFYHFSRRRFRALVALAGLALRHPAWTIAQFRRSAPARLVHERRMKR